MTGPDDRFSDHPPHEWLAAYADGELDATTLAHLEAWLADNPDALAELETQRHLSGKNASFWRAAGADTPSEASWSRVLSGIRLALTNRPQPATQSNRRRLVAAVAAVAVALLAAILLWPTPSPSPESPTPPAVEAFAIAGDDDIDIISLPGADADLLVVGKLPLDGAIVLATLSDIALINVAKDTDGMMPTVQMQAGPNSPMIICPMPGR